MNGGAPTRTGFTDLALTAANRGQARAMLRTIRSDAAWRDGFGAAACDRLLVVPDGGGRRVGSGVATLAALVALVERERRRTGGDPRLNTDAEAMAALLRGRTVAIVHSGGDSRRLPAYAAEGKIFAPMPDPPGATKRSMRIEVPTLFERIVEDLDSIESPAAGGVIVASGDVWLDLASQAVCFGGESVECVAFAAPPERGTRHGVFVATASGEVERFLQKPSLKAMRSAGCLDGEGRVLVDSGLAFIPMRVAAEWVAAASCCGVFDRDGPPIDLYADLLPVTATRWSDRRDRDPRVAGFLDRVRELASAAPLRVQRLERCAFRHAGSTRELLAETAGGDGRNAADGSFRRDEGLDEDSAVGAGAFVDRCGAVRASLGARSILVGVPSDPGVRIEVPSERGLLVVPVHDEAFAAIAFALDDDFKTARDAGGTVLGVPLDRLGEHCWSEVDHDRTLWTARIWPVGSLAEVVARANEVLADPSRVERSANSRSAAEIFASVDHRRLAEERQRARFEWLRRRFERGESGEDQARLARALSEIAREPLAREEWRCRAFAAVASMVGRRDAMDASPQAKSASPSTARTELVALRAPVRIDLAGGWTDTPPICVERGGAVVNVAIEVDGEAPLEVSLRRIAEPIVRIESRDLGRSTAFLDTESLLRQGDPRDASDWALLPRTAIAVSGLVGPSGHGGLAAAIDRLGGGFELRLASRLPKGSGLGTSSILGALTLAALARFGGHSLDRASLIAQTSELEQRMGTAGGWQDQAGGITAGAKLLETSPGTNQVPIEIPLAIPESWWRERVLVHSTGLQRLARNILQQVVWRWLGGGRRVVRIVDRIHETAIELRGAIERGDEESIAGLIGEGWRLKCELDPGSTTPEIEAMVEPIRHELSAWTLPGAGGGGFLFLVARDAAAAERIRDRFTRVLPHEGGRFHEVLIAQRGIREVDAEC
ncbi:MAG: fucose pyrophosphorylase domain-containing protein [Phycisphaerales bacterium]